jgi:hypothetical protein
MRISRCADESVSNEELFFALIFKVSYRLPKGTIHQLEQDECIVPAETMRDKKG